MRPTHRRAGAAFPRAASWEDPALLDAARPGPGDDALVVEPSGDDALLACARGARVTAVVPDGASAALVELKRAAARELPVQSIRSFLGFGHFGRRVWFYHYLRAGLPPAAQAWGDAHEDVIRAGLSAEGAVERAVADLRRILAVSVGAPAVDALLAAPDLPAQRVVLRERWSGLRWRAAAPVALPRIARAAGAEERGAPEHLRALLEARPLAESPFARALLRGEAPDLEGVGGWLGSLAALKANVASLGVRVGTRAEALARGPFDVVSLGRRPLDDAERNALLGALRPGARVLGWGPAPAGFVVTDVSGLDRGVLPGRPWVAVRT